MALRLQWLWLACCCLQLFVAPGYRPQTLFSCAQEVIVESVTEFGERREVTPPSTSTNVDIPPAEAVPSRHEAEEENENEATASDNDLIPPIFILNLDRAPHRWTRVQQEIEKAGISAYTTRLSAVDGKTLPDSELRRNTTLLARIFQPRGVLGCYLSHRMFWQKVVTEKLPYAIVLEDDVVLVEGFRTQLQTSLRGLRDRPEEDTFDVAMLGAIGRVHPDGKDGYAARLFSSYIGGTRKLKRVSAHWYEPVRPAGTHGYLVSQAGAQKLLNLCPNAVYHVDLDAWRHQNLVIRVFQPMLVFQTFDDTTLTDVAVTKKDSLYGKLRSWKAMQRLHDWTKDPVTQQPWSHVLAEPMMQLGPGGPVLTVERHVAVVGLGCLLSTYLELVGKTGWAKLVLSGVLGFMLSVRSIIWLLMNWR